MTEATALSVAEAVDESVPFETDVGSDEDNDAVLPVELSVGEGGAEVPPGKVKSDVLMADAGIMVESENVVAKDGVAVRVFVLLSVEVALIGLGVIDGTSSLSEYELELNGQR